MTDRPIIFSGPMVRAMLAGTKTQTRRVLTNIEPIEDGEFHIFNGGGGIYGVAEERVPDEALDFVRYDIGDRLWVRETWNVADAYLAPERRHTALEIMNYAATPWGTPGKWRSPIHMPRWASRLTLTVTDVRVQRMHEISEADALAEGVELGRDNITSPNHVFAFQCLWDSINADRAPWESNPWVVALTFTVHRGNIDQMAEVA